MKFAASKELPVLETDAEAKTNLASIPQFTSTTDGLTTSWITTRS